MDHAATAGAGLWGACGATTTGDDTATGTAAFVSFGRSVRGWSGAFWKGDD
jgi:hypothetical protein